MSEGQRELSRLDPAPSPPPVQQRSADVVAALLQCSSRELVRSLREPLHAITLDSDLLAGDPDVRPPAPTRSTTPAAIRLRAQRFRRQVASISRAIEMLENTLDQRAAADAACDLVRLTKDAVQFLAPFAARHRRRLALVPPADTRLEVDADGLATWQTVIVLMAERLLAVPEGDPLRIELVSCSAEGEVASGPELRLSGAFIGLGPGGDVRPSSLSRLLDSESLERSGAHLRVRSAIEVALAFEVGDSPDADGDRRDDAGPDAQAPALPPLASSSSR
jgi:hypothetical protein